MSFPYDGALLAAVQAPLQSIADVLSTLRIIDATCDDGDGLKWFNWLYLRVTTAVEARVSAGGFTDPGWLSELDVQFAGLYCSAVRAALSGGSCPGCWRVLFDSRDNAQIARIQFALAGVNAHINHDLPEAIVSTCEATATVPQHGSPQYGDYSNLNSTLDAQIDAAKKILNVRLLGQALPPVSHLEDLIAAWGVSAAREKAYQNAEVLWHLRELPDVESGFMDSLDGLTTFAGKALLVPVP